MSGVRSYKDLLVWQKAMDVAAATYELTRAYPREELFGLTSQSRRAAVSIAANIAEGYGRDSRPSFIQFLRVSQGSLKELETHLLLAARVTVTDSRTIKPILRDLDELGKMLRGLIKALNSRRSADPTP